MGSQGRQDGLAVTVEPKVSEQAHQTVGHDDEAEGGFRGQEVLQAKCFKPEVLLQLPYPVLAVGSAVVDVPDLIGRQVEIGHLCACAGRCAGAPWPWDRHAGAATL